ncbi:MAG TPA: hypothetical protein VN636_11635 [Acidimicrobiia bacterium]|nr:hypothetical protein [Acidimicrobiia bacterium]
MNVIDFFDYLAAHGQTAQLAGDLFDVWAAHQLADAYDPAA